MDQNCGSFTKSISFGQSQKFIVHLWNNSFPTDIRYAQNLKVLHQIWVQGTGDPPVTRILGLLQIRVIGKSRYRRSFKYYFTIKRDFWIFKVHFLSFLLLIITPKTHAELIEWSNMSIKCQSNPQRPRNIFRLFFRF